MTDYVVKDSGERAKFETGAQRDTASGKGRFDLLPVLALKRLAQLYERGALKYDARNWEKGIPVTRMFDSAIRHVFQAISGDQTEDHLASAVFNLLGIMEYEERADIWDDDLYENPFKDLGELYYRNNPKRLPPQEPLSAAEFRAAVDRAIAAVPKLERDALGNRIIECGPTTQPCRHEGSPHKHSDVLGLAPAIIDVSADSILDAQGNR